MNEHKALIEKFYTAFQQRDYATMAACYHPQAHFQDEAFTLKGKQIGAMWHMLCERGTDLDISFSISTTGDDVSAHWEPKYTFSQTGRFVHNIIDAEFEFKDGLIISHIDRFNFWRWSRQALGLPGVILGWSSMLQNKVRAMAMKSLDQFLKKHPEYQA